MKYLIQTETRFAQDNFIFTEDQAKRFIKLACEQTQTEISMCIFRLKFGSAYQLFIRPLTKGMGGYVEDRFGNLEFNF